MATVASTASKARLARTVPTDATPLMAATVPREPPADLDVMARLAWLDLLARLVCWAPTAALVLKDLRVLKGVKGPEDSLVSRAPRVTVVWLDLLAS